LKDRLTNKKCRSVFFYPIKQSNHYEQKKEIFYLLESTAERRARRNRDIKALFLHLTVEEGFSFMDAYEAVGYQFYLSAEISDKLVSRGSIKKPMSMSRLGMVLQQAGFQSKRMNHGKTRGWIVRERGLEEVNANRNIEGRG